MLLVELTGKKLPDAVSIVPFVWDEDGKTYRLIVTREFRPTTGGYEYSFPAGLRNGDEAVELTVARELHEETGRDLQRVLSILPVAYSSAGMSNECLQTVYCIAAGKSSTAFVEDGEDIEICEFPFSELADLAMSRGKYAGAIHGARSQPVLLLLSGMLTLANQAGFVNPEARIIELLGGL